MQDITRTNERNDHNVWKGLAAGLIGGLVASWTMNRFQDVWIRVAQGIETSPGNQFQSEGGEEAAGVQDSESIRSQKFKMTRPSEPRPRFQRECLATT
jgi:hypothetical protein